MYDTDQMEGGDEETTSAETVTSSTGIEYSGKNAKPQPATSICT
jgi:hypothetical protein